MSALGNYKIRQIVDRLKAQGKPIPPYDDCWPWNLTDQDLACLPAAEESDKYNGKDGVEYTIMKETV
jgi:hypothetical protein